MNTTLFVIDAQKIYTSKDSDLYCEDAKVVIKRINELIQQFQKKDAPIVLIRHIHKTDGSDLGRMYDYLGEQEETFGFMEGTPDVEYDDNLIRPKKCIEIVKNRYSAFEGTELNRILEKNNIKRVVICGFMTNFCCESTARAAHDKDYFVDFILDATSTPGTDNMDAVAVRRVVGEVMELGFARVMKTKEYLEKVITKALPNSLN